jgi:transposase
MAQLLEYARRLAVQRVIEGDTASEAAEVTGASLRSVRRWLHTWRAECANGLITRFSPGAPRKLSPEQESQVLGWLAASPTDFGFPTERWTSVRIAVLIEHFFGVEMNHRYLNDWFSRRSVTPQMPERVPQEKNPSAIKNWVRYRWPRIKKKSMTCMEL